MNIFDAIVLAILAYFAFLGFKNGFLREVLGLAGVIIGLFLAFRYLDPFNAWLVDFTGVNDVYSPIIAFCLIFFGVILAAQLAIISLEFVAKYAFLSTPNRVAGLIFGLFKSSLFVSLFILLLAGLNIPGEQTRQQSMIYPYIIHVAPTVYDFVGNFYPGTEDFASSVQRTLDDYNIERFRSEDSN